MTLNPPQRVRAVLYLLATFATPTVLWASSTGRIDDALTVLLGSYITIVSGLAAANSVKSNESLERTLAAQREIVGRLDAIGTDVGVAMGRAIRSQRPDAGDPHRY